MRHLLTILCFSVSVIYAQNTNNSLLWEISGNGTTKPSYLYGTMHVSSKVAFRLDDIFYKALNNSDVIALESDPTKWLNHTDKDIIPDYNSYRGNRNFYDYLFELQQPKEVEIRNNIKFDNRLINHLLFRKSGYTDDFEEETYLDMFIFQAGKKHNKPILGLEDILEARYLTTKASYNVTKKKIDDWLIKLLKTKDPYLLQENVYRDRNIQLLDSIGKASNTQFFREHMLFKRNENMVAVLDSIIPKKSVFAGVGAAHLAGKNGMLNLLKQKGYTVKPLTSNQTNFANQEKEKLNNLFVQPQLSLNATPDKFITINSFSKLREFNFLNNKLYISPDMTNGAYLTINRISTYQYLPSENPQFTLDKIDNLLYEDIPGKIVKKEKLTTPFPGISILNVTKKGNYQKYHIYKTPLELIIVKLSGKKDYVLKVGDSIFNSIEFKSDKKNITVYAKHKKYSINLPEDYIAENIDNDGKKVYQAYTNDNYFILEESPVSDIEYIEDDTFEAKYIVNNFLEKLKLNPVADSSSQHTYKTYQAHAVLDSTTQKNIYVKSVIKDESYYLMAFIGKNQSKANTYFNTLKFHDLSYSGFKKVIDTSLYFSVETNTKPPLSNRNYYGYGGSNKPYDEYNKKTFYATPANEFVYISKTKYHDLQMFKNIDSLWSSLKSDKVTTPYGTANTNRSKDRVLKKYNEKKWSDNNIHYYTYNLQDSNSLKRILVKHIQKEGSLFTLKTMLDAHEKPSEFISKFYETFTPQDTLLGKNIFTDKTETFFKALKANDSITHEGFNKLKYNNTHTDALINAIKTTEFTESNNNIKLYLIDKLGALNNPKSYRYLMQLYKDSYAEPDIQAQILNTFYNEKTDSSLQHIIELLKVDLPLQSIFNSYNDASKDSSVLKYKKLFPELLKFTSVNEYKTPIYSLLATLKDSGYVKPKLYKKYKMQITNDGKIQIKRSLGQSSYYDTENTVLTDYIKLLFPYKNEKDIATFFDKLILTKNANALANYFILLKKAEQPIPKSLLNKTVNDEKNLSTLIKLAQKEPKILAYLNTLITQEQYAKSLLMANPVFNKEDDTVTSSSTKKITTDDGKNITVYFFNVTRKNSYRNDEMLYYFAFKDTENNTLQPKLYYENSDYLDAMYDGETPDEKIKKALKLIKHKNRKRINTL